MFHFFVAAAVIVWLIRIFLSFFFFFYCFIHSFSLAHVLMNNYCWFSLSLSLSQYELFRVFRKDKSSRLNSDVTLLWIWYVYMMWSRPRSSGVAHNSNIFLSRAFGVSNRVLFNWNDRLFCEKKIFFFNANTEH